MILRKLMMTTAMVAMFSASQAWAGSSVRTELNGNANIANIEQVGNDHYVLLLQNGDNTQYNLAMHGDGNGVSLHGIYDFNRNTVSISQNGNANFATSMEASLGGDNNEVNILQTGNANSAGIGLGGSDNTTQMSQNGNDNIAGANLWGDGNIAYITQKGDRNNAGIQSFGNGNATNLSQTGNDNTIHVLQRD